MTTDEKFTRYGDSMVALRGEKAALALEAAMSQMLEMHCTPSVVWNYAERELRVGKEKQT